ncbi:hypothetical protein CLI85_04900 [Tannerella forsythia]|nr:hypothetical protein CLI85_04900 [Tannerella forsythia]
MTIEKKAAFLKKRWPFFVMASLHEKEPAPLIFRKKHPLLLGYEPAGQNKSLSHRFPIETGIFISLQKHSTAEINAPPLVVLPSPESR